MEMFDRQNVGDPRPILTARQLPQDDVAGKLDLRAWEILEFETPVLSIDRYDDYFSSYWRGGIRPADLIRIFAELGDNESPRRIIIHTRGKQILPKSSDSKLIRSLLIDDESNLNFVRLDGSRFDLWTDVDRGDFATAAGLISRFRLPHKVSNAFLMTHPAQSESWTANIRGEFQGLVDRIIADLPEMEPGFLSAGLST